MWVNKYEWSTLQDRLKILEKSMEELRYSAYTIHPQDKTATWDGNYKRMYFSEFYYSVFLPLLKKLGVEIVHEPERMEIQDAKKRTS